MPDKDSNINNYQYKLEKNLAERSLITIERSQKLDLLIHLLANLRKVLVVCGPTGIGKTTLLESLHNCRKVQWDICRLTGAANLNYETIIIDLCRFLNLSDSRHGFDIDALRQYCTQRKVVLIVDDAGQLAPGLIDTLAGLAESLSGLRLVFAMTYDEFHIKVVTDKTLEVSHSIELPALNQKQCGEYLQNLSAAPNALLTVKEVTDSLVADLYRATHGIPGRILAEIPKLTQYQKRGKSRAGLWIGTALIVVVAGWFMKSLAPPVDELFSKKSQQTTVEPQIIEPMALHIESVPNKAEVEKSDSLMPSKQPAQEQNPVLPIKPIEEKAGIDGTAPVVPPAQISDQTSHKNNVESSEIATTKPLVPVLLPPPPSIKTVEPVTKHETPAVLTSPPTLEPPAQPIKKTPDLPEKLVVGADESVDWIMAQPAENFTLQVMVLSTKAAAERFLKKYPQYSDNLKYYVISKYAQQKFVLIYGSFISSAEAKTSKAELPAEFNHSLEKRFKLIQNESRR